MFGLGAGELLLIVAVALVVLGPDHLPKVLRSVGRTLGELRRASTDMQRVVHSELAMDEQANTTSGLASLPQEKPGTSSSMTTQPPTNALAMNPDTATPHTLSRIPIRKSHVRRTAPVRPDNIARSRIRRKALHSGKTGNLASGSGHTGPV